MFKFSEQRSLLGQLNKRNEPAFLGYTKKGKRAWLLVIDTIIKMKYI